MNLKIFTAGVIVGVALLAIISVACIFYFDTNLNPLEQQDEISRTLDSPVPYIPAPDFSETTDVYDFLFQMEYYLLTEPEIKLGEENNRIMCGEYGTDLTIREFLQLYVEYFDLTDSS